MIEWISRNSQTVSAFLSFGMLIVWIVYLQVFVSNYRRQTRASILINRGSGSGLGARCLVTNMSSEAIYIHSIILGIELPDREISCPVTELDGLEEWQAPSDLNLWTRQGPLATGAVRDMGSFEAMLDHVVRMRSAGAEAAPDVRERIRRVTVEVIAIYGSEDFPVAAWRRFGVTRDAGAIVLRPETLEARQVRSGRQRRAIRRRLESELQEGRS